MDKMDIDKINRQVVKPSTRQTPKHQEATSPVAGNLEHSKIVSWPLMTMMPNKKNIINLKSLRTLRQGLESSADLMGST